MKSRAVKFLSAQIAILMFSSVCCSQSEETIRRTKGQYEREHPGERTYFVEELVKVLDSADSIMPNAKEMTFERSKDIGGAVFCSSVSWNKSKHTNQVDDFTARYVQRNSLRQLILENLLTDVSAFEKFMQQHKEKGFYRVIVWKPGYLVFFLIEGRQNRTGINYIVIPAKPSLFDGARANGANP